MLAGYEGEMAQMCIWGQKEINSLKPAGYHLPSKYYSWL